MSRPCARSSRASESLAARAPFSSSLAEELADDVLARFLRYVRVDTQGAYRVAARPSTREAARSLAPARRRAARDRARRCRAERGTFRVRDASRHGRTHPSIGLIAHVDTTPDVTGGRCLADRPRGLGRRGDHAPGRPSTGSRPGGAAGSRRTCRPRHRDERRDDAPRRGRQGRDRGDHGRGRVPRAHTTIVRVRRSGSRSPSTRRSAAGAEDFDLEAFGADVAYTLDGSDLGELEVETFSAASVRVTIRGLSVHPGTAKGKLVNAVKLASELVLSVPEGPALARDDRGSRGLRPSAPDLGQRGGGDRRLHRARPRRRAARRARRAPRGTRRRGRGARSTREGRRSRYATRTATCVPSSSRTRASSRRRSRRSGVPVSSRASRSPAAEPTAPCSRRKDCRRRISSPAGRSTTRCASGPACRTWPRRRRRSSSSPASGRNRAGR